MALSDTESIQLKDMRYHPLTGSVDFDVQDEDDYNRQSKASDTKRCSRCSAYYRDTDLPAQLECHYHTGKYSQCIRTALPRESGLVVGGPEKPPQGAKSAATLKLLNRFNTLDQGLTPITAPTPTATASAPSTSSPIVPTSTSSSSSSSTNTDEFVRIGSEIFFKHPVTKTDTVSGLALKYNVKASAIRKWNKLFDDKELFSKPYVVVPCPKDLVGTISEVQANLDAAKRVDLLKKFQREFHVTKEEASYYLSDHRYSWDDAVKQYKEDLELEKEKHH